MRHVVGSGVREREGTFKKLKMLASHFSPEIQNWAVGGGVGIGGDMSNF